MKINLKMKLLHFFGVLYTINIQIMTFDFFLQLLELRKRNTSTFLSINSQKQIF